MITDRKTLFRLLFVLMIIVGIGVSPAIGDSIMPENKVSGQVESKARRLMHDLKKQGFEVSRGYFKLWTQEDCPYTAEKMGTCYANNPAAPYVISTLPAWPNEFVDPVYSNLFGPSHPGYHDVYRFDPREALIILGQLPPTGAYFSEQTWLFSRQGTYDQNSQTYQDIDKYLHDFISLLFATVPQRPERIQVLSSRAISSTMWLSKESPVQPSARSAISLSPRTSSWMSRSGSPCATSRWRMRKSFPRPSLPT